MEKNRFRWILIVVLLFFALIFSLISIVNHIYFRTFALDLGMYNHAIFSFSHFKMNYFTLSIDGSEVNYFGDHFSPIIILLSPLYYLFGSYTLLLIQIIAIIFGGFGFYYYVKNVLSIKSNIALILLIHFFSIWGIYSALAFDFHSNVIAAMLFPWLFYFYERFDLKKFIIIYFLMLFCKENISLWLTFIFLFYILFNRRRNIHQKIKFEIPLLIFSFLYFIIITFIVMKQINKGMGTIQTDKYVFLGTSFSEMIKTIFTEPKYVFSLLFESPKSNPLYFGIKSEFYYMFLISGGIFILFNPKYLILIIPLIAQNMFSNYEEMWGIKSHYSIEFVPIIALVTIEFVQKFSVKTQVIFSTMITLITILATISTFDNSKALYYDKTNVVFYQDIHFKEKLNYSEYKDFSGQIPDDAIISVSNNLAPRLALRKKIYLFPVVKDASYIFIHKKNYYPLHSYEETMSVVNNLLQTKDFIKLKETKDLILLKRSSYKHTFLRKL